MTYLVYTSVIYCFSVFFNSMFLVYVASLGFSTWALIGGMLTTDWDEIRNRFAANAPVKVLSMVSLVQVVLFYLFWLKDDVPAVLTGSVPVSVVQEGIPTNPVHVLDMSMFLPAIALAGIWLWRRRTPGFGMAGVVLTNMVFQLVNVIGIMLFYFAAGAIGDPSPIGMFAVLGILNVTMLVLHLSGIRQGEGAMVAPAQRGVR